MAPMLNGDGGTLDREVLRSQTGDSVGGRSAVAGIVVSMRCPPRRSPFRRPGPGSDRALETPRSLLGSAVNLAAGGRVFAFGALLGGCVKPGTLAAPDRLHVVEGVGRRAVNEQPLRIVASPPMDWAGPGLSLESWIERIDSGSIQVRADTSVWVVLLGEPLRPAVDSLGLVSLAWEGRTLRVHSTRIDDRAPYKKAAYFIPYSAVPVGPLPRGSYEVEWTISLSHTDGVGAEATVDGELSHSAHFQVW